jgi:hypothetical protein
LQTSFSPPPDQDLAVSVPEGRKAFGLKVGDIQAPPAVLVLSSGVTPAQIRHPDSNFFCTILRMPGTVTSLCTHASKLQGKASGKWLVASQPLSTRSQINLWQME